MSDNIFHIISHQDPLSMFRVPDLPQSRLSGISLNLNFFINWQIAMQALASQFASPTPDAVALYCGKFYRVGDNS